MNNEWITKYVQLLYEKKDKEAFELKLSNFPSSFYKYRSLNDYTLECLEYSSVWMSPAENLNDPFESGISVNWNEFSRGFFRNPKFREEFKTQYNCKISQEEVDSILINPEPDKRFFAICEAKNIERDFSDVRNKQTEIFKSYQNHLRKTNSISSFSVRNDSLLLWSHYADSHKGICIEYDFNNEEEIKRFIDPVFYSNKSIEFSGKFSADSKQNTPRVAALSKALDWQYEKEWRLMFPITNDNSSYRHYKVSTPIAIYLGARFDENNNYKKLQLTRLASSLNIPIYKMNLHPSEYRIVKEQPKI